MRAIVEASEYFARMLRMPTRKALNPNKPQHFIQISHQLAKAVKGLTGGAEAAAMRTAIDTLKVDWTTMDDSQRDRVVEAARKALSKPAAVVAPKIVEQFSSAGKAIVGDTLKAVKQQYSFDIEASLSATDHKVIEHSASSQANFVRDQYGRLAEDLSETARQEVASGLRWGLGSEEIADNIKQALGDKASARSDAYWDMISMTFANRSRTYGNLSGYAAAGIENFTFEAVMDERTSEICALMHGKRFAVESSLSRFTDAEDDPDSIQDTQPWVSSGVDEDGKPQLFWTGSDGTRNHVAHVNSSGGFTNALSDRALEAAGITTPPLHGNCRSTILPED